MFGFPDDVASRLQGLKKPTCPKCQSNAVLPILYGLPSREMEEAHRQGEIELGGCIVWVSAPNWRCTNCHHAWRKLGPGSISPPGTPGPRPKGRAPSSGG